MIDRKSGTSVEYSFTVTLHPKTYILTATGQYDLSYSRLHQILRSIGKDVTCIAEITHNFNLHYHGIITFELPKGIGKNCMKVFKDAFRGSKTFGFVDIRQITNRDGWIEYIGKSLPQTRVDVDRPPIICDDHAIVNEDIITLDNDHMYQDLDQ